MTKGIFKDERYSPDEYFEKIKSIETENTKEYTEFVNKFKPKRTDDDVFTPPNIYKVIKDWAVNEYSLQGYTIKRPFYPGGDYKSETYAENDVVIDNPPFSILSKIIDFYIANEVKFFLFAPYLTLFSLLNRNKVSGIVMDARIKYANGALVATSFITNLEDCKIRTAPILKSKINEQLKDDTKRRKLKKHNYPLNVISSSRLGKVCDKEFKIYDNECFHIRKLDCEPKSGIFGAGFLISDIKLKEIENAKENAKEYTLSEREKLIIEQLNMNSLKRIKRD